MTITDLFSPTTPDEEISPVRLPAGALMSRYLPLVPRRPDRVAPGSPVAPATPDAPLALDYRVQPAPPDIDIPRMDVTYTARYIEYDGTAYYDYNVDDC